MQSKYIIIGLLTVPVKARIEQDGKVPELMWYLVDEDCKCRRYSKPPTVGATRHHKMKKICFVHTVFIFTKGCKQNLLKELIISEKTVIET